MESDESIDLVDSEAVNAYGSVVAKEERKNPCEHYEEGENVDVVIYQFFLRFAILVKQDQSQLKFPAHREDLALERVVEVVVHAKQQIRIVTQTVSVADVPAIND